LVLNSGICVKKGVSLLPENVNMSGELPYTIDSKGRMSFPQRFRDIIGERFMLTRGANHRLVAYSEEKWQSLVDKISAMRPGKDKEMLTHIYVKGANPVETDKLGRILVPQALREYAGLIKDVYVVGAIDVAEIWDKSTYEDYTQSIDTEALYAAMAALE
jgi:MraZ protein